MVEPAEPVNAPVLKLPAELRCSDFLPVPSTSVPQPSVIITLQPPSSDKWLVLQKTGVIAKFSRQDALTTARCLNLPTALDHLETQTGQAAEMPLFDAFQLSYVAAALLDIGRAQVRPEEEPQWRTQIVREPWSAEGCRGRCVSAGRIYRLTANEPAFFLRITDKTTNEWE